MLSSKQYNAIFVSVKVLPDKKLDKECSILLVNPIFLKQLTIEKDQFKKVIDTLVSGLQNLPIDISSILSKLLR